MNKKKKFGWTAWSICGIIFASIGVIFVPIGWFISKDPKIWENGGQEIFRAVFCGIGGLFIVLGVAFIMLDLRRRYLLRRAYNMGNFVEAEILRSRPETSVSLNGTHPNVIECAYTDAAGVVHIYRSRFLYTDVWPLLKSKTVPVYIDRDNENFGFVDIDAVLPEIKIH